MNVKECPCRRLVEDRTGDTPTSRELCSGQRYADNNVRLGKFQNLLMCRTLWSSTQESGEDKGCQNFRSGFLYHKVLQETMSG